MADIDTTVNDTVTETTENVETVTEPANDSANENAEIARLKKELLIANNKNDALAKENAAQKKAIRAKQSAEEIAAEEKRVADEARDNELNELRKRFAVAESSKKIMSFVGDDSVANTVAEYLFGAEDVDGAIDAFNKAWIAKEKKLRMEFGRLPAPGMGGSDGPMNTQEQLSTMTYTERVKFANEHPAEYNKLMGR